MRPRVNRLAAIETSGACRSPGQYLFREAVMSQTAADRIEQALARIEAAATVRTNAEQHLRQRHARLRSKVEEALTSIDALLARESAGPDQD